VVNPTERKQVLLGRGQELSQGGRRRGAQRSQHANRRAAMQVLQARLAQRAREQRRQEIEGLRGEKGEISFANQIRSYVLQPYTLVKDLRTGVETSNVQAVLDGDLDAFIRAYLLSSAGES